MHLMMNFGYLPSEIARMTLEQKLLPFMYDQKKKDKRIVHCSSIHEARKLLHEFQQSKLGKT
jgi:hypothetical protein